MACACLDILLWLEPADPTAHRKGDEGLWLVLTFADTQLPCSACHCC